MAKKRLTQTVQGLLKSALKLDRNLSVKDRFWLWRSSLISSSASPSTQAGFILPTVTLLLLMLSLVLGVLIFRTGNRTNEVIGARQQRQVYNAATPAIDRARAKLEYLFTEESIPTLPTEEDLEIALEREFYNLPGEDRIKIGGPADVVDAAWVFTYDSKGLAGSDGANASDDIIVSYSILTRAGRNTDVVGAAAPIGLSSSDTDKANNLVVRNGPINLAGGAGNPNCPAEARSPYQGWQEITKAELRKSVQVHAFAIAGPENPNKTVATLEMQQDKVANLGNKWGAWFRGDLELFPGPEFRWNGAINTGGSYFMRSDKVGANYKLSLYPISAPSSCVFTPGSSEMVMPFISQGRNAKLLNGDETFQGQFVVGSLRDNKATGGVNLYSLDKENPLYNQRLTFGTDSTLATDAANAPVIDLALEPVRLLTEGLNRRRSDGVEGTPNTDDQAKADAKRDAAWENKPWVDPDGRITNRYEKTPFVDDTYRADNRWGPKPVYSEENNLRTPEGNIADPESNLIEEGPNVTEAGYERLTRRAPDPTNKTDEEGYGLDGYWERRAKAQGVRVVVGQRLELGNVHGWKTDVDANGDGVVQDGLFFDKDGDGQEDPGEVEIDHNGNGRLDFDPLYPPPANPGKVVNPDGTTTNSSMAARQNELMQWKTLRANPAAAQSTAVYHYLLDGGDYPVACLASASHPGSEESIRRSTTFKNVDGLTIPNVNFLTGEGTNGWEFAPYGVDSVTGQLNSGTVNTAHGDFEKDINDDSSPLRIALSNLAYFSGDLAGAFPAFQDVRNGENAANSNKFRTGSEIDGSVGPVTHPYPILSMWGDFSNLRRVINQLDGGPGSGGAKLYDDLSLADKTTLQTASCTLGILAYNLDNQVEENVRKFFSSGERKAFETAFNALGDDNNGAMGEAERRKDGQIEINGNKIEVYRPGGEKIYEKETDDPSPADIPPEILIEALQPNPFDEDDNERLKLRLRQLQRSLQIERDRLMGFNQKVDGSKVQAGGLAFNLFNIKKNESLGLQCNLRELDHFGYPGGGRRPGAKQAAILAMAYTVCPRAAKYPSLYYLFPKSNHDHIGKTASGNLEFLQPDEEPYTSSIVKLNGAPFDNRYAYNRANDRGANIGTDRFRVVGDDDNNGILGDSETSFQSIALLPKNVAAWALPNASDGNGANVITLDNDSKVSISLLDKGIFNGREHMGLRVLDFDLDLLRNGDTGTTGSGTYQDKDFWLPLPIVVDPNEAPTRTGAAIYAFREDAMREDGIARPRSAAADDNLGDWQETWRKFSLNDRDGNYLMQAHLFNLPEEQDPPVNPFNGISPKPVDYFADPLRRPFGFRLRNGSDLRRPGADQDGRGLSFVTDNSVYIQGDFNVHSTNGTAAGRIEEYTGASKLDDDWGNFYEREGTDLNQAFARPEGDTWRASEIVSDAINILSSDFKDGSISDLFLEATPTELTSYTALNNPIGKPANLPWLANDGRRLAPGAEVTDLKISQRGFPVYCARQLAEGELCGVDEQEFGLDDSNQFLEFWKEDGRSLQTVGAGNKNFVNTLVVSGVTPSRVGQANGGLHNFPRMIESWNEEELWFAGSLFQLTFSHTSTASYDQEAWQPDTTTQPTPSWPPINEQDAYFSPPSRRWGYDVGLQYVQPTPVALRFAGRSNIRSEFYQELPVDDPYIVNLRCAAYNDDGDKVDQSANDCT